MRGKKYALREMEEDCGAFPQSYGIGRSAYDTLFQIGSTTKTMTALAFQERLRTLYREFMAQESPNSPAVASYSTVLMLVRRQDGPSST